MFVLKIASISAGYLPTNQGGSLLAPVFATPLTGLGSTPVSFGRKPTKDRKSLNQLLQNKVMLFALAGIATVAWLMPFGFVRRWAEKQLIYIPSPPDDASLIKNDWLRKKINEVRFLSKDGVELYGWYIPATPGRATVVISSGQASNLHHVESLILAISKTGCGVMAYDYRGMGSSKGSPSEKGLYNDLEGTIEYLKQKGIRPQQMILVGGSLGGAITADVASRLSHEQFKKVVLVSTFTSVSDGIIYLKKRYNIPRWVFPLEKRFAKTHNTLAKIGSIQSPLVIVHGDKDILFPFEMAQKLHQKAKEANVPVRLVKIPNGTHSNLLSVGYDAVVRAITG